LGINCQPDIEGKTPEEAGGIIAEAQAHEMMKIIKETSKKITEALIPIKAKNIQDSLEAYADANRNTEKMKQKVRDLIAEKKLRAQALQDEKRDEILSLEQQEEVKKNKILKGVGATAREIRQKRRGF